MKNDKLKIKKRLEKLSREIILLRDNSTCQYCNKKIEKNNAHISHVIPKSHGNFLRYDLNNLKLLCFHCHINWWHKNPMEASEWFKIKFPERWEYLQKKKNIIKKLTITDLKEIEIFLIEKLLKLKEIL